LAWIGNTLEARGDIDAVAENVVCLDDNVAKIDADPIFNPMMLRHRCVASKHVLLDDDTAPHSFDGTVENRKKSVTCGFYQPSVMTHNAGFDEVTLDPLHAKMRSFFIDLHEAAVARDIAGDNRRKTARR
jgi:L-rhamnose isomerase